MLGTERSAMASQIRCIVAQLGPVERRRKDVDATGMATILIAAAIAATLGRDAIGSLASLCKSWIDSMRSNHEDVSVSCEWPIE